MSEFKFCSKEHIAEYIKFNKEQIKNYINDSIAVGHVRPRLLIVQVGDNPASNRYVKGKISDANEVGIEPTLMKFPSSVTYDELYEFLNLEAKEYHAIIIQKPTNKIIDSKFDSLIQTIAPEKDVDGFRKDSKHFACTPLGVVNYLAFCKGNNWFKGKHAVIVGRSELVGRPLFDLLLDLDCTVTVCHSKTRNLKEICKSADLIVSAVGKGNMIDKEYIKDEHTVVINVGFDFNDEGKMIGDINVNSVKEVTEWCTPVVGSTGLLTRLMLMMNTYNAYLMQEKFQ